MPTWQAHSSPPSSARTGRPGLPRCREAPTRLASKLSPSPRESARSLRYPEFPPMIDHEQLAEALQRLDAREREVLHLSLRRRVPDSSLGEVLGGDAQDVARRRAAAIDRLADDLGVQRGEDLGHMLKALLEQETWEAVDAADAEAEAPASPAEPELTEPDAEDEAEAEPTEAATETAVVDPPPGNA